MNWQICVDSSIVLKLGLDEPDSGLVAERWDRLADSGHEMIAPSLLWYEVTATLRKLAHRGALGVEEASRILPLLLDASITSVSSRAMHHSALKIATRLGHPTAYDAHYLALAETRGCEFWTADRSLYSDARTIGLEVTLLG